MIRRLMCASSFACLLAAPLAAEPGLPPEEAVAAALMEHPSVTAAHARLEAARARAEGIRKGSYEFSRPGQLHPPRRKRRGGLQ